MTKFWKVVKASGSDAINSTRYQHKWEAIEVAERLCGRYKEEYVVLEATCYCSILYAPVAWHSYED